LKIKPSRLLAIFMVAGLVFTPITIDSASAKKPYPSQQEVLNARKNVAKKRAMIKRLQGIITNLTYQEVALEKIAMLKAEKYNQAKDAEDAVAAKVKVLQKKVNAASAEANQAQTQLAQIASQMWRNGAAGTSLNLFLNGNKAGNLLYKLGAQEQIASSSDQIFKVAIQRKQYAKALQLQLKAAKADLAIKTEAAQTALQQAQNAANALQKKVDQQKALNRTFTAQLATLENISISLEAQRVKGLADEARQNDPNAPGPNDAPSLYDVGPPSANKVAIAVAFAKEQLGEHYVLGAMGPNLWDCSGLTKGSYAAAGIYIGTHSATNQFYNMAAKRRLVPLKDAQPGDLMWYSYTSDFNGDKYHVVIYLGDGMMIESPNPLRVVRIVPLRHGDLFEYA
jgi:cell wall-associated NlpC family hydrolase